MKRSGISALLFLLFVVFVLPLQSKTIKISKDELLDKIKGGWAAQTIGCTFGGPTEFRFRGTFIQDYQPIKWEKGLMKWWYENAPGLYDDIYMDLTFVEVFEKEGLDAPVNSFANAYANADYMLWHANQAARYNILNGIMPPKSGHWLYNPHSEDIDFQIEADFAGLMSPGMMNSAADICDKIGHIMNYGDGWYGGVYVAAMYALAFVSDDIHHVVEEALKMIPPESEYAKCMGDVIKWHNENPDDWKATWFKVQRKWSEDVGCPDGVFTTFNIDAKINSAWILLGLLYGDMDFGKTISISARSGDDSDCNPASAGGILGTMLGYRNIPDFWKQGLAEVEALDFKYTTISLNDTYEMSMKHALEMIRRHGGKIDGEEITLEVQEPGAVKLEVGFEGHYPVDRKRLRAAGVKFENGEASLEFEGIGFAITGRMNKTGEADCTLQVEMYLDGQLIETSNFPTDYRTRKPTAFWRYQLSKGKHVVLLKIVDTSQPAEIELEDLIIYDNEPAHPKY